MLFHFWRIAKTEDISYEKEWNVGNLAVFGDKKIVFI
jgi:hypothetical protein